MRPLAGLRETGIAFWTARVSISNGSASASAAGAVAGRRFAPEAGFCFVVVLPASAGFGDAADGFAEGGAAVFDGAAAGFAAAAGEPDMEAPQNGQFSASSSRTDALQDGQVLNSMNAPFVLQRKPGREGGREKSALIPLYFTRLNNQWEFAAVVLLS
jgi:hypothetical protein